MSGAVIDFSIGFCLVQVKFKCTSKVNCVREIESSKLKINCEYMKKKKKRRTREQLQPVNWRKIDKYFGTEVELRIQDSGACAAGINYPTGGSNVSPVTTHVQPPQFKISKSKDRT